MANFEGYERRIDKINAFLAEKGIKDLDEARDICLGKGVDVAAIVRGIQPIAFENAVWAYTLGAANAIKSGVKTAAEAAEKIGEGLQAFCVPGSVADQRKVGLGHGNLAAMLPARRDEMLLLPRRTRVLRGGGRRDRHRAHREQSPQRAAPRNPERPRQGTRPTSSRASTDSRSVETKYDYFTGELKIVSERAFSDGDKAKVKCYGADDVSEGVAIMIHEGVDVSITGNSTNPTRFQHPVAGTLQEMGQRARKEKYFSVASGGGTGRTLHPDNMAAGPASYRNDRHDGPHAQRRAVRGKLFGPPRTST